jgi:putative restriction endonuclease
VQTTESVEKGVTAGWCLMINLRGLVRCNQVHLTDGTQIGLALARRQNRRQDLRVDLDWDVRLAAFDRLNRLREQSGGLIQAEDMKAGVVVRGERIALFNEPVGIWRPRQLGNNGAALSVTTTPPKPGKIPPYDDDIGSNSDFLVYRYQREGPTNWMNRSLLRAMELERPLIYFYGVAPRTYEALYPLYVTGEGNDATQPSVNLSYSPTAAAALGSRLDTPATEIQRAYSIREVKVRLHQHRFRELVLRAYQTRCAVCQLRHDPLLDAAHILPDRDERGRPEVPNGLSLCKIHHTAYDTHILGIDPDLVIHIRHDILEEHDGPMLQHGLKDMHGRDIKTPRNPLLHPNPDYLAERFGRFQAA